MRIRLLLAVAIFAPFLGGCAKPAGRQTETPKQIETPEQRHARLAEKIQADPVAFLRETGDRVAKIEQYRCKFYRQERMGIPAKLQPMELLNTWFRQTPFSVKFTWDDEEAPYYESLYVANQNEGHIVVRERKSSIPFFPPTVRSVDPQLPVTLGKSKNPITDFGLRRIMERTILPFDIPEVAKVMTCKFEGIVNLEPMNRPAYYIRIERPRNKYTNYVRQDFYVDAETLLPAGTDLYLPNNVLDARYRYADIDTNVHLTDADFKLSSPNKSASKPAPAKND